jgi:hypothetical protein
MCTLDRSAVPSGGLLIYEDDELVFDGSDPATYVTLDDAAAQWGYDLDAVTDGRALATDANLTL